MVKRLTKSAEVQAEPPLSINVLKSLFKHFDIAHRVEHDVDYDGQSDEARDAHPGRIQQVRQRHKLHSQSINQSINQSIS